MSWRGLDHRTIYDMVVNGGQGTGMSIDAEQRWAKVQQTITDAEQAIGTAMGDSQTTWEGAGADSMRGAYTPLGTWALDAAASAQLTAISVRNQGQLAFETRRLVTDNAPPDGFLQEAHAVVGTWDDGRSVYDDQADAVDRLMVDDESASQQNEAYFDTWSVPPTVAVSTASAAPAVRVQGRGSGRCPTPRAWLRPVREVRAPRRPWRPVEVCSRPGPPGSRPAGSRSVASPAPQDRPRAGGWAAAA